MTTALVFVLTLTFTDGSGFADRGHATAYECFNA